MAVPIEILGLENLLAERVYIKWVDDDGCWTLGSCMPCNKKKVDIIMKVVCNSKSKRDVHIQFSIKVAIKISGKRHYMYMLLAVPPHGDFQYASEDASIQKLDDLSYLDASALHEAGISNLERIIVLNFDIRFAGFVVQKEKESTSICPFNKTSSKLIRAIKSLSLMKKFKVYIRPSDYARQHLKEIRECLHDTSVEVCESDLGKLYFKKGITLVNWTHFKHKEHKEPQDQPPPLYTANDTQRATEVQVPRSPLIVYIDKKSSPSIDEAIIPVTPSPVPVCHGIFSSSPEELSDIGEGSYLDDDYKDLGRVEVNSDEEYLAEFNARQLDEAYLTDIRETSRRLRQDATSEALASEFREWLDAAAKLNPNVLEHRGLTSKLLTLGESVRESDVAKFDAVRPWCSALLFYNPTDSSSTSELQDSTHRLLVSDMAGLIKSINTFQRGAEMAFLMEDFIKLGGAARAGNKEQYTRCKVECQFRILVDEKSSKGLSSKRNTSEIDSNVYKRTRTAA
ncbi:uncharacterized protein EAE97_011935 [Botrytis byssoidea]|uniref:Uncharacterized protein n=1 Tax=Botrytis byssoidea TaxID=139641 RepID=A0A9P5HU66_9HELO|nr:uncharacterized protein EAE97_011935 [Botrytis byssoidea]KAF7918164.1 hypothetical protein EAE97_011935 [Botrytis byssoidea]